MNQDVPHLEARPAGAMAVVPLVAPEDEEIIEIYKAAGFGPSELQALGFPLRTLRRGFTPQEVQPLGDAGALAAAGYSAVELHALGFSPELLRHAGFEAKDLWTLDLSLRQLRDLGCSLAELRRAAVELKKPLMMSTLRLIMTGTGVMYVDVSRCIDFPLTPVSAIAASGSCVAKGTTKGATKGGGKDHPRRRPGEARQRSQAATARRLERGVLRRAETYLQDNYTAGPGVDPLKSEQLQFGEALALQSQPHQASSSSSSFLDDTNSVRGGLDREKTNKTATKVFEKFQQKYPELSKVVTQNPGKSVRGSYVRSQAGKRVAGGLGAVAEGEAARGAPDSPEGQPVAEEKEEVKYYSSEEENEQDAVKDEAPVENEPQSVVPEETPVEPASVKGEGKGVARSSNWTSSGYSDYSYESEDTRSSNWGNRPQETWWNYTYGGGDWRGWQNRGYYHYSPYGWSGYYRY
eukprot:s5466_g1.t1